MEITASTKPFRHWVIDGAIPEAELANQLALVPSADAAEWIRYDNPDERKRTYAGAGPLFVAIQSWPWLSLVSHLTGIDGLAADDSHYGSGLHVTEPGGFLQCHLDFSIHPETGMERRVNLLAYLNDCEGGATQLWDSAARQVVREIAPKAGRVLIWECSETAYHGAAEVKGTEPRVTAAAYYYTAPRPGCSPRQRALFIPRR